jgi:post-segregation antitoxin (ccd killing protein)
MSEIVTVRVGKELKNKIKKHRINASKVARAALEEEIKKHEAEELAAAIGEMKALLSKVPDVEITKAIRESRDQR